jgi:hypothetical protein
MNDHALNALLAEYVAPPVPAGLAGRVAAAALALPQEPRLAYARRAGGARRHDRRGQWLRRPWLLGGLVLGLAVSGAVAATLAGVRLDRLPVVEAVLGELPFGGRATPPQSAPPPRAVPPALAAPVVEPAAVPEARAATPREDEPPAPRAAAIREAPPVAPPERAAERSEVAGPRLIETRPPAPPLPPPAPPPIAREERIDSVPAPEPPAPAPGAGDEARLHQERIERAERLRAARQAQIERLQRIQQRRERIRRLRRD